MKKHFIRICGIAVAMFLFQSWMNDWNHINLLFDVPFYLSFGALFYWIFRAQTIAFRDEKKTQARIKKQKKLVPFETELMTLVLGLDGSAHLHLQCRLDGCDGYLARKSKGDKVFCLKCRRTLSTADIEKLVSPLPGSVIFT